MDEWPGALALLSGVFVGEGHVTEERSRRVNRREAIEPSATLLVARERGAMLGVVVLPHRMSPLRLMARDGEAEIRMLAVAPEARGRGIGEALVGECIGRAVREQHAVGIALWTQPQMAAAQRLYVRMGFARAPERDAMLTPGSAAEDRLTRWAYVKDLRGVTGSARPQAPA